MRQFKSANREQPFMFPPSIDDYLEENHLARYVVQIVDQLSLNNIYQSYSHRGSEPFDPKLLMALLFYAYCTGIFSSRKIEKATFESIPFIFIADGLHPDHDTINRFRLRFLLQIEDCFTQVLLIAESSGIFELGNIHLDGTKIRAKASKHKAMSFKRIDEREKIIRSEIQELMLMAEAETSADNSETIDIPKEILHRDKLLERLKEAAKELKLRASQKHEIKKEEYEEKIKRREEKVIKTGKKIGGKAPIEPIDSGPEDKDQYNFTDPESRIMKTNDGFQQCYNAQAVVDQNSHLILGQTLCNHANDKKELLVTLDSISSKIARPVKFAADNGYYSDSNVKGAESRGMEAFIATGKDSHHSWLKEFGQKTEKIEDENLNTIEKMTQKLRSEEGKEIYRHRKSTVETVFGIIKEIMGFRRFSFRGSEKVSKEWNLVCLSYNLKRMFNLSIA
jgi:transposase